MLFEFGAIKGVTIIPQTTTPLLDSFSLDVTTTLSVNNPGRVSSHAIQSGRESTEDDFQLDPPVIQCAGKLSDTPLGFSEFPQKGRARSMEDLLSRLRSARTPLKVVTSLTGSVDNRIIKDYTATLAPGSDSIEISLVIHKVNIRRLGLVPSQVDADIQLLGIQTIEVGEF